ncbi:electron transfer flavoprotein-ubiquinone oxidoreductase [Methylovirgula sp. HY1]|uniref:electron transfer flavoprotein-ubiquinone oxidoreductase n=1 Tax=Methylovirgula sp. HY1 TaxID=2822761 RepID=UPI001C7942CA|nr:electron transfer flavoprotein-ubiquinone oxidoreductase [Methylovirgula sp. HY1]QXX73401.1 Electron transfer flavoprotein-ubiquinone oxidoreductase [Methylovirgula sp. HY1]
MIEKTSSFPPRESMDFDVVIVGAGPAGLACAIRLKQLAPEVSIVVVEKGAELGAHILSGAVIDPGPLDALLPQWRADEDRPLRTEVREDRFHLLWPSGGMSLPNVLMPRLMNNHGNFIGSLGNLVRYLGAKAEALGVDIYPGFAATELLYGDKGEIVGIATGDMGLGRDGGMKPNFSRGMELRSKYCLFAEGARGSLAKELIARYRLDEGRDPQKYGLGLKELWEIAPERHQPGLVQHTFGWPLDDKTGGGSFLYHFDANLVSVGFVVHLDYANPTLSPFEEFQRFKTHPRIAAVLEGGRRIAYGARVITEGGVQSVPKLSFPGGALMGCSAGFVNLPRIKGSHNAIASGMLAAEHVARALAAGRANDALDDYDAAWRGASVGRDLIPVRNAKPLWSRYGTRLGVALAGLDMWAQQLFGASLFGTLHHRKPDHASLKRRAEVTPIAYPKPDGKLTFDRLSSVFLSSTHHEDDQPVHLHLQDASIPIATNLPDYGEPARLYCPAAVYEVVYADEVTKKDPRFVINAGNCIHCKCCDVKDPAQNINWVPPEGGGGPNYRNM